MQQQQPLPPAVPPPSQFDFIMNTSAPSQQRPSGQQANGPSLQKRILIVLGGFFILVILMVIFKSVTSNSNKANVAQLTTIAGQQTELIRVADLGIAQAKFSSNKNLAATVSVSIKTSKQAVLKLLASSNQKALAKQLEATADTKTDDALVAAKATNQVDNTFRQIMLNQLITYRNSIKTAYDSSKGSKERQVLSDAYSGATLILTSQVDVNGN